MSAGEIQASQLPALKEDYMQDRAIMLCPYVYVIRWRSALASMGKSRWTALAEASGSSKRAAAPIEEGMPKQQFEAKPCKALKEREEEEEDDDDDDHDDNDSDDVEEVFTLLLSGFIASCYAMYTSPFSLCMRSKVARLQTQWQRMKKMKRMRILLTMAGSPIDMVLLPCCLVYSEAKASVLHNQEEEEEEKED
eukprot:6492313-Amphidinium_carterae.1